MVAFQCCGIVDIDSDDDDGNYYNNNDDDDDDDDDNDDDYDNDVPAIRTNNSACYKHDILFLPNLSRVK